VATVANIDWPSKKGLSPEAMQAEFLDIVNAAQEMRLNAVVVQVRPTADAFYRSALSPWSEYLTGTQGVDPGFDPLAFMVEESHRRGLEFHAWFNPFRVGNDNPSKVYGENSVYRLHPNWCVSYGGSIYVNPGIPEARAYALESILEVVRNYDIDAVHFDDFFYPYAVRGQTFEDGGEFLWYGQGFAEIGDWRRENINQFIRSVHEGVKAEKSHVRFGVSPFGIWRSKALDPNGFETTSTTSSYESTYADTLLWVRNGWIDYIAPQIYWNFGHPSAPYGPSVEYWHNALAPYPDTHLYIGQAVYKINDGAGWQDPQEMPGHLVFNQGYGVVRGNIFYNTTYLRRNLLGFVDALKNNFYRYPALPPAFPEENPPAAPLPEGVTATDAGNQLAFTTDGANVSYFVLYRAEGPVDVDNPAHILALPRYEGEARVVLLDETAEAGRGYTYAVTAVSRRNQESLPAVFE
jgi:uncharacterized lipoprotein YddW (UPF0748 family)